VAALAGNHVDWLESGRCACFGRAGQDVLIGGGGMDTLYGGSDNDTFKFLSTLDSSRHAPDSIMNFVSEGHDRIDLSAIDANPFLDGDQAFFLGPDPFHFTSGIGNRQAQGRRRTRRGPLLGAAVGNGAAAYPPMSLLSRRPWESVSAKETSARLRSVCDV